MGGVADHSTDSSAWRVCRLALVQLLASHGASRFQSCTIRYPKPAEVFVMDFWDGTLAHQEWLLRMRDWLRTWLLAVCHLALGLSPTLLAPSDSVQLLKRAAELALLPEGALQSAWQMVDGACAVVHECAPTIAELSLLFSPALADLSTASPNSDQMFLVNVIPLKFAFR